jgi:hypothetical protein
MPRWSGDELQAKKKQALEVLSRAMKDMPVHEDWVTLTEILWQRMSDMVGECQLDVLRNERFGTATSRQSEGARARLARYEKYRRTLKALNFLFKCIDIDWDVFLQTVVDLVEGNIDVKGLDSPARRDQSDDSTVTPE